MDMDGVHSMCGRSTNSSRRVEQVARAGRWLQLSSGPIALRGLTHLQQHQRPRTAQSVDGFIHATLKAHLARRGQPVGPARALGVDQAIGDELPFRTRSAVGVRGMVQVAFPDDGSGTAVTEMMEGDAGNCCFAAIKY